MRRRVHMQQVSFSPRLPASFPPFFLFLRGRNAVFFNLLGGRPLLGGYLPFPELTNSPLGNGHGYFEFSASLSLSSFQTRGTARPCPALLLSYSANSFPRWLHFNPLFGALLCERAPPPRFFRLFHEAGFLVSFPLPFFPKEASFRRPAPTSTSGPQGRQKTAATLLI